MSDLNVIVKPGTPFIEFTRTFNAPPELVFKAHQDPEAIPRWWGPGSLKTVIEKLEPRSGGSWKFVQSDEAGNVYTFHGVFHEVTKPNRIVQTFEFDGFPGHASLNSMTLEAVENGKTRMSALSVFQSVEDRDGMAQSNMEEGMEEGFVRLDGLLKTV